MTNAMNDKHNQRSEMLRRVRRAVAEGKATPAYKADEAAYAERIAEFRADEDCWAVLTEPEDVGKFFATVFRELLDDVNCGFDNADADKVTAVLSSIGVRVDETAFLGESVLEQLPSAQAIYDAWTAVMPAYAARLATYGPADAEAKEFFDTNLAVYRNLLASLGEALTCSRDRLAVPVYNFHFLIFQFDEMLDDWMSDDEDEDTALGQLRDRFLDDKSDPDEERRMGLPMFDEGIEEDEDDGDGSMR